MNIQRIIKHLFATSGQVRRAFPRATLDRIEAAIKVSERAHAGEIRFVVEGALDGTPLFKGQSPRDRALDLFSQLRVWDTRHNNGVLVYVLLADQAVEIVADRGIHAHAGAQAWSDISRQLEAAFKRGDFRLGAVAGVDAVARVLRRHFPREGGDGNELPDQPVLL